MSKFKSGDLVAVYDEEHGRRQGRIKDVLSGDTYYVVSYKHLGWGYRAHEKQLRKLKSECRHNPKKYE